MNSPKITVLMSAYNAEKYLAEAIESVLNQTFKDFEFIIINDCSTDKTGEIIKGYATMDQRIRVINNTTNLGLTKSLNIGLKEARGEYVARLDADDVALPERLGRQYLFMENHPELTLVGSWAEIIDEQGQNKGYLRGETKEYLLKFKMLFSNQLVHSTIFFRRSEVLDSGGYNEAYVYVQDYELYSRLLKKYRLINLPEILAKYRAHGEAITKNQGLKENYKQHALKIIYQNFLALITIKQEEFQTLAEALIIKNSTYRLSWQTYRQTKVILKDVVRAFFEKEKLKEPERQQIIKYCNKSRKILFKKLIKSQWPGFYNLLKNVNPKKNNSS